MFVSLCGNPFRPQKWPPKDTHNPYAFFLLRSWNPAPAQDRLRIRTSSLGADLGPQGVDFLTLGVPSGGFWGLKWSIFRLWGSTFRLRRSTLPLLGPPRADFSASIGPPIHQPINQPIHRLLCTSPLALGVLDPPLTRLVALGPSPHRRDKPPPAADQTIDRSPTLPHNSGPAECA